MLRFGEPGWTTIVVLQPLFEEANRIRAILVAVMRELAETGIASILPDLPGMGDSPVATINARFEHWTEAVGSLSRTLPQPPMTVAVRGGALLDSFADASARWRLAPENGGRLLRDMIRATALTAGEKAGEVEQRAQSEPTRLAGNTIHPDLFAALERASCLSGPNVRTVGLDERADVAIAGTAIWRRAEPTQDAVLVAGMVGDIRQWVSQCAAR